LLFLKFKIAKEIELTLTEDDSQLVFKWIEKYLFEFNLFALITNTHTEDCRHIINFIIANANVWCLMLAKNKFV
jgi:hypothetical protein